MTLPIAPTVQPSATPSPIPTVPTAPTASGASPGARTVLEHRLRWVLGAVLLARLLFPFFNHPLSHLYSDPARHWENGVRFLDPTFMGSSDPYLYQLWLFLVGQVPAERNAAVALAAGFLCAALPYGWYRALKELLPKTWAQGGAIFLGLLPALLSCYAYFMNENLLLALTGFAFWATLRAMRRRSVGAFALACLLWLAAGFTRSVALPMALACLLAIWLPQPRRGAKALLGLTLLAALLVPAGLHGRVSLGYFAPFGNPYLSEAYFASGKKDIAIDLGPKGQYGFGSPSFYNPTFYPFSNWTTDRTGVASIRIDLSQGRASWLSETARMARERTFPLAQLYWENLLYLLFGQSWPDNDPGSASGWLAVWTRWIWPLLFLAVGAGAAQRRFRGREWLLPGCALGMFLFFLLQQEAVIEGRYRKPIDPICAAAAVVLACRLAEERQRRRAGAAAVGESPVAG